MVICLPKYKFKDDKIIFKGEISKIIIQTKEHDKNKQAYGPDLYKPVQSNEGKQGR